MSLSLSDLLILFRSIFLVTGVINSQLSIVLHFDDYICHIILLDQIKTMIKVPQKEDKRRRKGNNSSKVA